MNAEPESGMAAQLRRSANLAWSRARAAQQHSIWLATEIARTEENVAGTFERLARDRPDEADRLRALAAEARRFAASERDSAVRMQESE